MACNFQGTNIKFLIMCIKNLELAEIILSSFFRSSLPGSVFDDNFRYFNAIEGLNHYESVNSKGTHPSSSPSKLHSRVFEKKVKLARSGIR